MNRTNQQQTIFKSRALVQIILLLRKWDDIAATKFVRSFNMSHIVRKGQDNAIWLSALLSKERNKKEFAYTHPVMSYGTCNAINLDLRSK